MVVIIDYGMGNLRSIQYKLEKVKISSKISSRAADIEAAEKLILPGVGHFARGMENLKRSEYWEVLNRRVVNDGVPILGICLGMQLLTKSSEEGGVPGLGWIDAETRRFDFKGKSDLKIPHIGWNTIDVRAAHPWLACIEEEQRFYFVHSYHVCCAREGNVVARARYGYEFDAVIARDNIFGTQFHPEKSHRRGFEIIRNFCVDAA